MKQNFALTLSFLGGLMLLASACVKDNRDEQSPLVGSEIVFSAATSYSNQGGTRAVYSGATFTSGTSEYERIDWENNDRVKIIYAHGASSNNSDYKVTGITAAREKSTADVEAVGDKLVWESGDSHVFYAMYPTYSGGNHPNSAASLIGASVSGTIPADQDIVANRTQAASVNNVSYNKYLPDMAYAYMVGYKEADSPDGRVTIPFTPAVTAFNFIFKATSRITVTSFELISNNTNLTGGFQFDISDGDDRGAIWNSVTETGSNGQTITVSFGANGMTFAPDDPSLNKYLDFTVFTLPIDQNGLTIKFHCKDANNRTYSKTLELKDSASSWHTFAAGKKHVVTNDQLAGETVEFVFTVTDNDGNNLNNSSLSFDFRGETKPYKVTSYKKIGNKYYPLEWQVESYTVNGSPVSRPAWLSTFTTGDTPPAGTQSNPVPATVSYDATLDPTQRVCTTSGGVSLGTRSSLGTENNPYNLSTNGTANCYVVDAPGWYCFPMTYGNGAYSFSGGVDHFLSTFLNHNGNIGGAWVSNQSGFAVNSVELLWQDSQFLVSDVQFHSFTSGTKANGYIKFYVSPATINQGNAVIAVKSGSDIAWSWHIWVTDQGATNVTVRGKTFMAVNLGWCDKRKYKNDGRAVSIKLKQSDSEEERTITLSQSGVSEFDLFRTNPHYEWGRKDPMIPPIGLGQASNVNKTCYNENGTVITPLQKVSVSGGSKDIQYGIQHPTTMVITANPYSDWADPSYCNLWNSTQKGNISSSSTSNYAVNVYPYHGKTAYDPCPAGYTVPSGADLGVFNHSRALFAPKYDYSANWSSESGDEGYLVETNKWYASGTRPFNDSNDNVSGLRTEGHYYTSITYDSNGLARTAFQLIMYSDFSSTSVWSGVSIVQGGKGSAHSIRCVPE